MTFIHRIEGYHSSYLEGLRKGDLARSRRAVTAVGALLRHPLLRMCSWWRPQRERWLRLHLDLAERERRTPDPQGVLL